MRSRLLAAAPDLHARVRAAGPLGAADVSRHLAACDVMLQPYSDGVSTRRTSMMAALAHGRAAVTTSGVLTEPLWEQSRAVALVAADDIAAMRAALTHLTDDSGERARLGATACALYRERFDIARTIAALREGC